MTDRVEAASSGQRLPLSGVRILALEQFASGPFGSLHLSDLGADVIKIEDPRAGGDFGRYVPPYAEGEDSLYFETLNRGKESISLDLTNAEGRRVFEELVRECDAVYSNMRGDVPAKLGVMYQDLAHLNPAIVCCSLSGFGMTGPRQAEPGYDYILQAMAGWMDITGEPGGPPTKSGLSVVDFTTGYVAGLALVSGVLAARRDGVGMDCDVSLFDTAIAMLSYPGVWQLNAGYEPVRTRHSAHPSLLPFQVFESSDGWMVVGCAKEKFWQRFVEVIEMPGLAADPRFRTFADRRAHGEALLEIIEPALRQRTTADWSTRFRGRDVPFGEVNSVADALTDPQVLARDMIVEAEHPRYGTVKTLASPVRVGDRFRQARRAPTRGEHTAEVLTRLLGMSVADLKGLQDAGAFGPSAQQDL